VAPHVIIHIGTQRTGTTSIQRFLSDHRAELRERGIWYPPGLLQSETQVELLYATMRRERLVELSAFGRSDIGDLEIESWVIAPRWDEKIREAFLEVDDPTVVYSCEGLWWLRYRDELDELTSLFPGADVTAVVVLRDPDAFLDSYRWISRASPRVEGFGEDSLWYTGPSSWLVDYDQRISLWEQTLGPGRVRVLSYEECVQDDGSTIPALLDVLEIDRGLITSANDHHLNGRPS
jgi:hypothetical protein